MRLNLQDIPVLDICNVNSRFARKHPERTRKKSTISLPKTVDWNGRRGNTNPRFSHLLLLMSRTKLLRHIKRMPYMIEISEVPDLNNDGTTDLSDIELLLRNNKNVLTLLDVSVPPKEYRFTIYLNIIAVALEEG